MSAADYPRIPYGMGSFAQIRRDGLLYVDKTRFVRPLEDHRHAFLIRPRRFGKTCWLGVLMVVSQEGAARLNGNFDRRSRRGSTRHASSFASTSPTRP